MTKKVETRPRMNAFYRVSLLISTIVVLIALLPVARAEEASESADSMLENLKKRSAEERWLRVKKLYPSDPPSPRRKAPVQLPADHQQSLHEEEVPPSPNQQLIPRLTALPTDVSNDWVLPSRQPATDIDEAISVPSPAEGNTGNTSGNVARQSKAPVRVAAQDVDSQTMSDEKVPQIPTRALHERKISEINPYYDRFSDDDIREFALEKGKELDILFKPKTFSERSFPEITLAWEASNYTYHPLYFSDPALERYGHSHHPLIQPFASIARAGIQLAFLPYQMTILPICKDESPLGFYRPGDCTPKLHYQVPLNAQAAVVEAGVVSGLYFIIP